MTDFEGEARPGLHRRRRRRIAKLSPAEEGRLPVVPYVPPLCPRCGKTKPKAKTYGHYGDIRYHRCAKCGDQFLSRELSPSDVRMP